MTRMSGIMPSTQIATYLCAENGGRTRSTLAIKPVLSGCAYLPPLPTGWRVTGGLDPPC
jgi:hypothetical protein